jgi:hypothetical protein
MGPTDEEWWRARLVNDLDKWAPWQALNEPDANRVKQEIQEARQKRTPEGDNELLAIAQKYCPEGEQVSPYPREL